MGVSDTSSLPLQRPAVITCATDSLCDDMSSCLLPFRLKRLGLRSETGGSLFAKADGHVFG